ncbi:MAG: VanZ family protein [Lachnospiraceae bacterium]|nr:VanZ family protein [Lachnospiraceae bacterium]
MVVKKRIKFLAGICLIIYLLVLGYVLFFAEYLGRTEHPEGYRYNLTLFSEIGRFYRVGIQRHSWSLFLWNVCGNIAVFIPFGIFMPMLFRRCKNIIFTVLLSFELSLFVEVIQLITHVGIFDVDDILLNTFGGFLGFCIYIICYIVWRIFTKQRKRK